MSACIGWEGDAPCPRHGQFHGCTQPVNHNGRHECACGALAKNGKKPRHVFAPTDAHMRFGMPATWHDCVALGLDPLTGEPT